MRITIKVLPALFMLALSTATLAQDSPAGLRTLPPGLSIPLGTIIDVKLSTTVRTSTYLEGDLVAFEVAQPVVAGGVVVIEKGALAKGRIVRVKRARTFGRPGDLFFTINEVTAVNGSRIPVQLSYEFKGVNDYAATYTRITLVSAPIAAYAIIAAGPVGLVAAPVGLLVGVFRKGQEAEQSVGKLFEVQVRHAFNLGTGELVSTPVVSRGIATGQGVSLPRIYDRGRVTMNQILYATRLSDLH